ncbi:unnamed protein product, partial [Tetraodon nigroviridis]
QVVPPISQEWQQQFRAVTNLDKWLSLWPTGNVTQTRMLVEPLHLFPSR